MGRGESTLRLVVEWFGTSLIAVRLLSVLAGAATVPVVYLIGRRLAGRRVGVFASVLSAVSLPLVFWQQNARGYALGALFVALSTLLFLVMLESESPVAWRGYFAVTVLACYTVLFAALVVLAQAASLLARRWAAPEPLPGKRLLLVLVGLVVACAPLLVLAHNAGTSQIAWVPRPAAGSLPETGPSISSARRPSLAPHLCSSQGRGWR